VVLVKGLLFGGLGGGGRGDGEGFLCRWVGG
jgi:hypothetical protein